MGNTNYKFYSKAFKNHGVSARGVHWFSKETQYIRFKILIDLLKNLETSSLVDVGCGYGELLNYLEEKKINPLLFIGIDCEEFMIKIAKERFPKKTFLKCDILKDEIIKADYLLCSGALNILEKKPFLKAIKNCFDSCKKGFAFNFLTQGSVHELKEEEVLSFCKKLTSKISISNNYLENDSTFFLEK